MGRGYVPGIVKKLTLIFMIDALGFDQAGGGEFLPGAGSDRRPVETVLGYSSACIPSIMTGKAPNEHGHLSMYRRAQGGRTVFGGPTKLLSRLARWSDRGHWRMRQWLHGHLRRKGITGYFSLYEVPLELLGEFDLCQTRNIYQPQAFDTEGLSGLGDLLADRELSRVWDWTVPEEQAWAELDEELAAARRRVLFFYTPELDSLMHVVGPEHAQSHDRLSFYSDRIGRALTKAREQYEEVDLFVFGDHGMAEVRGVHDLWSLLKEAEFKVPSDLLYFLDSTMARFWFQHPDAEAWVRKLLQTQEYGRIVDREELQSLGAFFPDADYGELIFLLDEGHILAPSFMGKEPVRGMHGYHPNAGASFTTLVTNRPDIEYPKNLYQLHQVLRESLGEVLT